MTLESVKNNLFTLEKDKISFTWDWIDGTEDDYIELSHVKKMIRGIKSGYQYEQTFVNILNFYNILRKKKFKIKDNDLL